MGRHDPIRILVMLIVIANSVRVTCAQPQTDEFSIPWKIDRQDLSDRRPMRFYEPGLSPSPFAPVDDQPHVRPFRLGWQGEQGDRLGLRPFPVLAWPIRKFRNWFRYGDPDQQGRHIGRGEPLRGTSWLNRRWHVGWFFGGIIPDQLIDGQVDQGEEVFGGYRVGWDFDHYWGVEGRFAFAHPPTQIDTNPGIRSSQNWYWDVQLMYYPWGDSHWRPYASLGIGTASFRFTDHLLRRQNEILLHVPVGVGLKYYFRKWLALRADVMDNMAMSGSGLDTMHNLSVTGGMEVHFGGRRVHYSL